MTVLLETLKECVIFLGIAFAPVWAYIAFCLVRGILDDARKLFRKVVTLLHG